MINAKIAGVGSYLPGNPISNEDLCRVFDVEEWIFEDLGIEYRYWAADINDRKLKEAGYEMAAKASKRALDDAEISEQDIDKLILVTAVPDYLMPNSAVLVQEKLGISECNTLELHAACAGAIQALEEAVISIKSGYAKNVLVCCFNLMSPTSIRELNTERGKSISVVDILSLGMFGDGASAVIVSESEKNGILFTANNSIGTGKPAGMELLAGGAVYPYNELVINQKLDMWKHDAKAISEYGSGLSKRALSEMIQKNKLRYSDIDHYIFPQANPSMLKADIEVLKSNKEFPENRIFYNVDKVGNTSTPGLFIALDGLIKAGGVKNNDRIAIIGGEASKWLYGGALIQWIK